MARPSPPISWLGAAKVMDLIDARVPLSQIVDRCGRAVHPDAHELCSYHRQAKRIAIKQAYSDKAVRARLRQLDAADNTKSERQYA